MRSIIVSKRPGRIAKILNGEQSIIVFTTAPKDWMDYLSGNTKTKPEPMTAYMYCTKKGGLMRDVTPAITYFISSPAGPVTSNKSERLEGKVVAKFTLKEIDIIHHDLWGETFFIEKDGDFRINVLPKACVSYNELSQYLFAKKSFKTNLYAWRISDLVVFNKPKKLWEFEKLGSYDNPTVKCKKKEQGMCNRGKSPFTGKWVGCEKARLTKAPQPWCYVEDRK